MEEYRGSRTARDTRSKPVYDEPNLATNETFTPEAAKRSKLTERAYRSRAHLEAMMRGHGGVRADLVSTEMERVVDTMDKRAFSARKERIQEQFKLDSTGQRPVGEQPGHSQISTRKSLGGEQPIFRFRVKGMLCREDAPTKAESFLKLTITGQRPSIRELQQQLLDLEKGKVKKDGPPGHYVGKIGKDDWNVRLLEERLKEREKGTKTEKKKVEKPQVDTTPLTKDLESCENLNERSRLRQRENGQAPNGRVSSGTVKMIDGNVQDSRPPRNCCECS